MTHEAEPFAIELAALLPADLPNREIVIRTGAAHLALIVEANRQFNLTRITSPREAAIKHVLDSVMPWRLFADATDVMDAGTGAGFPGIPLALALPGARFALVESIGKKARFVEAALGALAIPNARVFIRRAEEVSGSSDLKVITARAVAPTWRAIELFLPAMKRGAKVLLYKGPDAGEEIAEASRKSLGKIRCHVRIAMRYDLPESMGTRTIVEIGL